MVFFPRIRGIFFGGSHHTDYSVGVYIGVPLSCETTILTYTVASIPLASLSPQELPIVLPRGDDFSSMATNMKLQACLSDSSKESPVYAFSYPYSQPASETSKC